MPQPHLPLVTGEQMARIDRRAIEDGTLGSDLMEAAGRGVSDVLEDLIDGYRGRRIAILCGKGNNGGDGFVVARLASEKGASVDTFLLGSEGDVSGDARLNLDRSRAAGLHVEEVTTSEGLEGVRRALCGAHAAVDALLGTGISGGARGATGEAIGLLSGCPGPIVAVDVPSGLDASTGRVDGPCAAATCTVTFGLPKVGQFFHPGRGLCGRLHLVDIGLPPAAVQAEKVATRLISPAGGCGLLPLRAPDSHKGDCGRVILIAGSVGLTGAATLAARAALRIGAGLVTVGIPESLNDVLEVKLTEAMTRPLPEVRKARCLSLRARGEIRRLLANADCCVIGPGLGTHRETAELIRRIIEDVACPMVLDADALNALTGQAGRLRALAGPVVVTPHPGEFARLTDDAPGDVAADPLACAQRLAETTGATVVLKGAPTVVATPEGGRFVNPSGNAGMATGGTGDVLAGTIAGLIAQGLVPSNAASLGVYIHGLAGDLAAEARGQAGTIAGDVASLLPEAEQAVRNGNDEGRYIHLHPTR